MPISLAAGLSLGQLQPMPAAACTEQAGQEHQAPTRMVSAPTPVAGEGGARLQEAQLMADPSVLLRHSGACSPGTPSASVPL